MKKLLINSILFYVLFFSIQITGQELSKSNTLGVGLAYTYPAYGISAKYNITETHAAQLIVGGASYGFGTSSLALSGRYVYNFNEGGSTFIYRPYTYGQLGYYNVRFDFFGVSDSFSTISFGIGGGVEFTLEDFIDGLYFNTELGYVGGSLDNNIGSFAGISWGGGIHYRFNL